MNAFNVEVMSGFDINKNGKCSKEEFHYIYIMNKGSLPEPVFPNKEEFFKLLCPNGPPMSKEKKEEFEEMWDKFDANQDGFLSKKEIVEAFSKLLHEIGKEGDSITKGSEAAWKAFEAMDTNGDGKISKKEMFLFMQKHGELDLSHLKDC